MPRTTSEQDRKFTKALSENISIDASLTWLSSFVFEWISDHFMPEEVFDICFLEEWAENNGYIKA